GPSQLVRLLWVCLVTAATTCVSVSAWAQLGPDLRPPGLDPGDDLANPTFDEEVVTDGPSEEPSTSVAAEWELNADTVVFSAASKRQLIAEAPSTVHVLTDVQMERYGWRSLADALRTVPGVQTRTWLAQYQSVMIR